ncbi:hypothetical protein [Phenylobacterium sp.]|uniref:hypothetical protein n=1 Tax=Phenylobacterium sp. TaxID=1871053 RepID=UPI0025D1FE42|nr:hypothetical protein [Phenylobacterium sp.]
MGKIFRRVRSIDAPRPARRHQRSGGGRDDAGTQRILVAEFSAENHIAEVIDGKLTVFVMVPMMDMATPTNGVTSGPPREAAEAQMRQVARDRGARMDLSAQIRDINQKNRDFWNGNGGGGR